MGAAAVAAEGWPALMYVYASILIAGLLGGFTGGWQVQNWRHGAEQNAQAREDRAREETRLAAQVGAAEAIAKIEVKNVTIQGRVQTIVRENTVYRDCRHAPGGVLDVNEALTGRRPDAAGGGKLPGTGAAH